MSVDRRIRDGLQRSATSVTSDLDDDLRHVRAQNRRLTIRRRAAYATFAVVAIVAVIIATPSVLRFADSFRQERPATPGPTTGAALLNPFSITDRIDLAALGVRHPLGFAIGPDGNVYLTDADQTVNVVSPDGRLVRRWGKKGAAPGQFRLATGAISVGADGLVYVSDTGNFRVQVFSATGTFIRQFGSFGTGRGEFQWPFDIAVDAQGNAYVADDQQMTVSRFSPTGRFVWRIGGLGTTKADLTGHEHLVGVDARGRIVMANDDQGRIVYVDRGGREVDAFGTGASGGHSTSTHPSQGDFPGGACNASVDATGYTVVNSCADPSSSSHNTSVFDPAHQLIGRWPGSPFAFSPRFGPGGEIFALDYQGDLLRLAMALPGR
jgi:hypothetical protein